METIQLIRTDNHLLVNAPTSLTLDNIYELLNKHPNTRNNVHQLINEQENATSHFYAFLIIDPSAN